jgi:GT2 family glycosyltransferase
MSVRAGARCASAPPAVSVIVALNAHSADPTPMLEAHLRQTMPPRSFEVIVVDNGSRPAVAAALAGHISRHPDSPLRIVPCGRPGRGAANNAGVRAARSDLVAFVADDFVPAPTLVRAHVEFHRDLRGPAAGVGPAFFPPRLRADPFRRWLEDGGSLFGVAFGTAQHNWPRAFFYVGNASLPRRVFERLGGFDEVFEHDLYDDFEFGLRLAAVGVETRYLPKALATHDHPVTVGERLRALHRCGEAARACEARNVAVRPWADAAARPLADHVAQVMRSAGGTRAGATAPARDERYRALTSYAFAAGYRGAPLDATLLDEPAPG